MNYSRLKINCLNNTSHDKMKIDLADPTAVLIGASRALEDAGLETATYGGLALAMYGEPRETKDADLAVADVTAADAEVALRSAGFDVLRAFDRVIFGGQNVSRLTLIGGVAGSLNTVDLVEPRSRWYAARVQERALTATVRNALLRVVSPEDFVILKLLATRERDLEDARTVMRALAGRIDVSMIESELAELPTEIADYDFAGRWRKLQEPTG